MVDSLADEQAKNSLYEISQADITQNYWCSTITGGDANANGCTSQLRKLTRKKPKRLETETAAKQVTEASSLSTVDHRVLRIRQWPQSNLLSREPSRVSSTLFKANKIVRQQTAKKAVRSPSTQKLTLPSLSQNPHERVLRHRLMECSKSTGKSAKKCSQWKPSSFYGSNRKHPAFDEYSNEDYARHLEETPGFLRC